MAGELLSASEAAEACSLSKATFYRKTKELRVPSRKVGGVAMYDPRVIDQFFTRRTEREEGLARVIALANQKGGIGKTTTCLNLGLSLAAAGKRVLFIDLDAQANITSQFTDPDQVADSVANVLGLKDYGFKPATFEKTVIRGRSGAPDLLPATIALQKFNAPMGIGAINAFDKVKNLVKQLRGQYDYILIDTPPTLDIKLVNALNAAQLALVPCTPAAFSLQGLKDLRETVQAVVEQNPDLKAVVVINRFQKTRQISSIVAEIREYFPVLDTHIHDRADIEKAQALDVHLPEVNRAAFSQYEKLAIEIAEYAAWSDKASA